MSNEWTNATCIETDTSLFTDLYELTMVQAYFEEGMTDRAVFSLFVRRLPASRNYLVACGIDTVLGYLEHLRFSDDDIRYLASLEKFSDRFLDWLREFRFSGDVHAVAEGTPVFANEPVLEVEAPLPEAQLIETFLMNQVHLQTLLASKAARVVTAAAGRPVIDFGSRRMHGLDAALKAGRSFHIGGVTATSNVLAGKYYGLPLSGTMAHSYIQAHENEREAFREFARIYPGTVILVDTYDTLAGIRHVIDLVRSGNADVSAVRLDSGDLAGLARAARRMLDEAGLDGIRIFVSGGLDEYIIEDMLESGAPVDGFGVGTRMGVSNDAPDLDIAYKLCEYAGKGRLKLSPDKPVLPGRKQVFRVEEDGVDVRDIIGRRDEEPGGFPLLSTVMVKGKRRPGSVLNPDEARERAQDGIARLPERVRALPPADPPYPVTMSDGLNDYRARLEQELQG